MHNWPLSFKWLALFRDLFLGLFVLRVGSRVHLVPTFRTLFSGLAMNTVNEQVGNTTATANHEFMTE